MKISIIVPILNEAETLPGLLEHLSGWRDRGCEVLLVDGGSRDDSAALAVNAGFDMIPSPRGRASQMNAGARVMHGKVLLFLHADTRLPPDALHWIEAAMREPRRHWGRFDVRIDASQPLLRVVSAMINLRSRLTGISTGDQAMFVRRELFHAVGGFPDQPLMEDVELSRRLKRQSRPACLAAKVVTSARRWQQYGKWRTITLMWWLRWCYWRGVPAEKLADAYLERPVRIIVMAKAPIPGYSKTRLIPDMGENGAAGLSASMTEQALNESVAANVGAVEVCASPTSEDPHWATLQLPEPLLWSNQVSGELGARMDHAVAGPLARGESVILIGTDCPELDAKWIAKAAGSLRSHDAVMIPARDGGFVLLGLKRYHPSLFADVAWSSEVVAQHMVSKIRALRWPLKLLPPLSDIDTREDLTRLPADMQQAFIGGDNMPLMKTEIV
ncbi:MAG: TIGR04283 family arsenosugar biosynthesis glycosyltransferase [Mariprofundaceae bacterium]|nr:TIGR04283 family arsenosugar biosynthesis glycosyltransferase [Mariprofundaceae bacterium]